MLKGGSNMNGDNQQILREIVLNPTIHGKELESIFGLSRRQLDTAFKKSICGLNKRVIQNLKEQAKEILL